jgi:hypothetical protein
MVSMFAIGPKVRGFKPGLGRWIIKGDKNPQHALFRRVSKTFRPHFVWFYGMLKIHSKCEQRYFVRSSDYILRQALLLCYYLALLVGLQVSSGGRIRTFLCRSPSAVAVHAYVTWRMNSRARWWLQFRDVVSPHRHDDDYNHHNVFNVIV